MIAERLAVFYARGGEPRGSVVEAQVVSWSRLVLQFRYRDLMHKAAQAVTRGDKFLLKRRGYAHVC